MKIFKGIAACAVLMTGLAGTASADDSNWGVGLKAGTLGLGVEARWSGLPWVDFRIGGNAYTHDTTGRYAGIRYDAEAELQTYFLTANFHFPLSPFRFTAGAFSNGNEASMVAAESGDITIGGQTWTQEQVGTLTGKTTFGGTSPYAGFGMDFELFGKAGLNFDLGVLWQGEPQVSLTAVGGTEQGNPAFDVALQAEADALVSDLGHLKAYPVVSLSFVYNF